MKKVYVVGEAKHYADFITGVSLVENIEDADIVIFTGGEDVDPSMYGVKKHPQTYSNLQRDLYEKEMFEKIKPNQLVVGVCRGSQYLCVLNGGKLVQHCTGHGIFGTHSILCGDMVYEITSTHHQMQYPFNLNDEDYTLIGISYTRRSLSYEGDGIYEADVVYKGEPEIVLYHKKGMPRCLAIQGHPEYMRKEAPVVKYLNKLINDNLKIVKNNENN
jgi:gamma-glutamyl-gamma-aminobutyrate hydrolase PuuD